MAELSKCSPMELQSPQISRQHRCQRASNGQGQISQGRSDPHNPLRNAGCTLAYQVLIINYVPSTFYLQIKIFLNLYALFLRKE